MFTGDVSKHFDINRLSTNYHRVALPQDGGQPVKIKFSDPDDDSIRAAVFTRMGQTKNITALQAGQTFTITNPVGYDDMVVIVNNYSRADKKSSLGGTEPKSYKLDVEINAPLVLFKDYRNSAVANIYHFSCNEEALMWVEETNEGKMSTNYFSDRFFRFGATGTDDPGNNNEYAMLSGLNADNDELIYAYQKYTPFFKDDTLFVWAKSERFDYSVSVLKHRLSYPADTGNLLGLAISNKKVYYSMAVNNYPSTVYDVWKYDLSKKKRTRITTSGQGPDQSDRNFFAAGNYLVWDKFIPKWENDNVNEKTEIWLYDDNSGVLRNIFSITNEMARIELFDSSDEYVCWTYLSENNNSMERKFIIYDIADDKKTEIRNFDSSRKIEVKGEKVAFYDSTATNLIVWKKESVKIIEGIERPVDFFLGNYSVGWVNENVVNGFQLSFYMADFDNNTVKSYTTPIYPMPQIDVLGYADGSFYYLKKDDYFLPEGIYKLNMNAFATGIGEQDFSTAKAEDYLQNYPNPFDGNTTIFYKTPISGQVRLKVLDIRGRVIAILVNRKQNRGEYKIHFSPGNLSNGMYTLMLTVKGQEGLFVQTRKMILIE